MKKNSLLLSPIFPTLTLAALLAACGSAQQPPTPSATATAAPTERAEKAPSAASAVSADEREVLAMYDEMVQGFDTNTGDCGKMASAVDAALAKHAPAFERVQASLAQLPQAGREQAQARLEQTQGPRLLALRRALQSAVAGCGQDQRLVTSLMHLSKAGAAAR